MHPEHIDVEVIENEDSNIIYVIQGKIGLEAVEDKILVLIDKFRSGYECKRCNETGVIGLCACELEQRPGTNRLGGVCKICNGSYESLRGKECPDCKGSGQTIIIPESTKSMPTSGKIVSRGPKCTVREIGERVIFGAHTGYFIPFKGNVRLRMMREHEPLCLVHAIDPNVVMDDFMVHEEPINNSGELERKV